MSEETSLLVMSCLIEKQAFWEKVLSNATQELNQAKALAARKQINAITAALKELDQL